MNTMIATAPGACLPIGFDIAVYIHSESYAIGAPTTRSTATLSTAMLVEN